MNALKLAVVAVLSLPMLLLGFLVLVLCAPCFIASAVFFGDRDPLS